MQGPAGDGAQVRLIERLRVRYDAVIEWWARVLIYPLERWHDRLDDKANEREARGGMVGDLTGRQFAGWCVCLGMLFVFLAVAMR